MFANVHSDFSIIRFPQRGKYCVLASGDEYIGVFRIPTFLSLLFSMEASKGKEYSIGILSARLFDRAAFLLHQSLQKIQIKLRTLNDRFQP